MIIWGINRAICESKTRQKTSFKREKDVTNEIFFACGAKNMKFQFTIETSEFQFTKCMDRIQFTNCVNAILITIC